MVRYCLAFYLALLTQTTVWGVELPPAAEKQIDFQRDIFPLLEAKCHDCHGEFGQEGNFRLDRKSSVLRGGDSGEPGIVIGKSEESHLIRLVAGLEADLRMPPDADDALNDQEIALLRAWIDQDAPWPGPHGVVEEEKRTTDHWAFQPVVPIEVPQVESDWARNPIDHFILAKLNERGLQPNPVADRRTLVRRLSLDLLGLPVAPDAMKSYLRDEDPDATDRIIHQMLESPYFGQRWATHWLDLVRFAETHGFETNRERPNAWRYRDYVVRAFNEDMPYDQFIREQIAGDSFDAPIAMGYLVAGPYDQVKSPDVNLTLMQRQNELDDIINTTSTAFLGLTVGCARCHNHKFDPILQTDYYSMQAIFAGVNHGDMNLPLSEEAQQKVQTLRSKVAQLEIELSPFVARVDGGRFVLIDDDPQNAGEAVKRLSEIAGVGSNRKGKARGQANDSGDTNQSPNVSGGKYSWWKHQADKAVFAWAPQATGKYRIWLSWGCGYDTHCQDAQYVIDRDGDPSTHGDWEEIAIVNQQHFANGEVSLKNEPLWSGFFNAAVATLDSDDQILLVGGSTGSALTADVLLLEHVQDLDEKTSPQPIFREALDPAGNVERIEAQEAKYVRFVIEATNRGNPCLDELAIYSGDQNVGLADQGGVPTASGSLKGHPIHKLKHINDGRYSNDFSWIADSKTGWVQIELPQTYMIDRIEWSRDQEGKYTDRLATLYRIETSLDGMQWRTVAHSSDRLPTAAPTMPAEKIYRFDHLPAEQAAAGKAWLDELQHVQTQLKSASKPDRVYSGTYKQPGPTHRLYRGEPLEKREQVPPNAPEIFTSLPLAADSSEADRRKELAQWIASPENPLTARVMVNRLWQFHFGKGLVDTPSDFGAAGIPPTHPGLLDWLAAELIRNDWSLKYIHRLILQSATYQQSSRPNSAGLKVDGGTEFLWRYPPHRLEAEPIRDSILAVSGVLDLSMGGPGFSAFQVEAENVRHYHPKKSFGPEDWRRMVYMTKVRMEKDAVFGQFDCPDAATSIAKRTRSTTPLQALNLFNSPFLLQQAELFAQRLKNEAAQPEAQIALAIELCYGRPPTQQEQDTSHEFIQQQGLTAFCRALLNSNEFLFIQ
ncbi:DUF1553 domain-containing protein [Bremerella alba]|uniref:F5/8 type C domain-containing protein n=1 Tax=Bremerella alba TaxID=980252 RepID=A0A7V9AA06_9BACT|nr:DUF1553 domain-containing protein [Bremerella alba]MBA2117681.1 hypothetical protein [Bremerella alba]